METLIFLVVVAGIIYLSNQGKKVRKQEEILKVYEIKFENEYFPRLKNRILSEIQKYENLNEHYTPHVRENNLYPQYQSTLEGLKNRNITAISKIRDDELDNLKLRTPNTLIKNLNNHAEKIKKLKFEFEKPRKPEIVNQQNQKYGLVKPEKSSINFQNIDNELLFDAKDNNQRARFMAKVEIELVKLNKAYDEAVKKFETLNSQNEKLFADALNRYHQHKKIWEDKQKQEINDTEKLIKTFRFGNDIDDAVKILINSSVYPSWLPKNYEIKIDKENKILIVEHQYPDIENIEFVKLVDLKNGKFEKSVNQREKKEIIEKIYPLLTLRLAVDIAHLDDQNTLELIVINGWVNYRSKAKGKLTRAYVASLAAPSHELKNMELPYADVQIAFKALKGNFSRTTEITPIAPLMRINTDDPRFIDNKDVLDNLNSDQNLAAMNWEEFEHLCRELFERIFAKDGATVKVTQASRDQGVDAVIIDPRPIYGGKTVVQAKRYINTVDVAAVRDLYGTVQHEGANKGILVTTSQFGPDAYNFIKGKNIELINGPELLYLLSEYGYKFKIDLEEARKIQKESGQFPFQRK